MVFLQHLLGLSNSMKKNQDVDIAIIGAGITGIATAYYLCEKYKRNSIILIDARDPMTYTSAQSGDNYRNWWPSEIMTQFTDHSIGLMHDIARQSSNVLQMKQRGYALATRRSNIDGLLTTLESNYTNTDGLVRVHHGSNSNSYIKPHNDDWNSQVDGVDVLSNKLLIQSTFPAFSTEIEHVLHIRKAGDISGQQMGAYMLEKIKPLGCQRLRGYVENIVKNDRYTLEISTQQESVLLNAEIVINAAGPYVGDVANMLGTKLPIENVFHQKIAFEDTQNAVPRNQPFSIDIDEATLSWSNQDRAALEQDSNLAWLTKPIDGGIHCRPEGTGRWVKLGWAYNRKASQLKKHQVLMDDPMADPSFPEIVIRGAARLNPSLEPYINELPKGRVHYGGYYTMTKENWPLIGPLNQDGAFVVGALSGFGSMSSCAAGSLCADWVCGSTLPKYAHALSLNRYKDPELIARMSETDTGLL